MYILKTSLGSKSGTRETSREAVAVAQAGDYDGVDEKGCGGEGKQQTNFRGILVEEFN